MHEIPKVLEHRDAKGRIWRPYEICFKSPEGNFSTFLYAISFDHALLQLDALKETGMIGGELTDIVDA